MKFALLCSTVIPAVVGAGFAVGAAPRGCRACNPRSIVGAGNVAGDAVLPTASALLPEAKPKPQLIQLAQCKPCKPCAAKSPCAPKGACNPCNPCAAAAAAVSKKCFVPRLQAAWAKHPCNPCNPCRPKKAACTPCKPCAAKNPCAAKACNPCNPCGAAAVAEVNAAEATAVYGCLLPEMTQAYGKAGLKEVVGYTTWLKVSSRPYQSATHGSRYVNNYANNQGANRYKMFEKAGKMPIGSVLAKDSFVVQPDGKVAVGPLFIMEKMKAGFNKESGDWRYTMVMPDGKVAGITKGKGMSMKFCAECHAGVAPELDHIMLVPSEYRMKF